MANEQFKITHIQQKIDINIRALTVLRFVPIFFMSIPIISVLASRLMGTAPEQKNFQWGISLILIVFMFVISVVLIKKNTKYKMDLYYLEKETLERKKRVAKLTNEPLSDYVQTKVVKKPTENASYPVVYYGILLMLDIMIKVLILDAI